MRRARLFRPRAAETAACVAPGQSVLDHRDRPGEGPHVAGGEPLEHAAYFNIHIYTHPEMILPGLSGILSA